MKSVRLSIHLTKLSRQYSEIKTKIDSQHDVNERNKAFFQYQNSLKSVINRMNKLISEASTNGKDVTEYSKLRSEIQEYNTNLLNEVLGGTLGSIAANNNTDNDSSTADTEEKIIEDEDEFI